MKFTILGLKFSISALVCTQTSAMEQANNGDFNARNQFYGQNKPALPGQWKGPKKNQHSTSEPVVTAYCGEMKSTTGKVGARPMTMAFSGGVQQALAQQSQAGYVQTTPVKPVPPFPMQQQTQEKAKPALPPPPSWKNNPDRKVADLEAQEKAAVAIQDYPEAERIKNQIKEYKIEQAIANGAQPPPPPPSACPPAPVQQPQHSQWLKRMANSHPSKVPTLSTQSSVHTVDVDDIEQDFEETRPIETGMSACKAKAKGLKDADRTKTPMMKRLEAMNKMNRK